MRIGEHVSLSDLGQEPTNPGRDDATLVEDQGAPVIHLDRYMQETPSGGQVTITAEEEAEAIREAITANLVYKMTRWMEIEKAMIGAVGNAIGFAIGGFLIGMLIKDSTKR
jgi:hypothetical protein